MRKELEEIVYFLAWGPDDWNPLVCLMMMIATSPLWIPLALVMGILDVIFGNE